MNPQQEFCILTNMSYRLNNILSFILLYFEEKQNRETNIILKDILYYMKTKGDKTHFNLFFTNPTNRPKSLRTRRFRSKKSYLT